VAERWGEVRPKVLGAGRQLLGFHAVEGEAELERTSAGANALADQGGSEAGKARRALAPAVLSGTW